jgi:hypothetical protein
VKIKSPGVSVPDSSLFTLENLYKHKVGSQELNYRAVLKELNYTQKLLADFKLVLGVYTK